ncbi:rubrerythrin family protein [Halosegnis marinus]|uniref:Rubrerythrin family protein n=1 Tax=Halosegnis marinus TaxID=3034023 RepID=A0ABD5ZN52_9EURY|nr:rubrerythrin family protein [Halosegnis sp. DT85]
MNADEFVEAVRSGNETALSRLGSSKSLYADTRGEMEPDAVLRAAADAEHAAAETFAAWADGEDGAAGEAFAATAEEERDHYERVAAKLDDHEPSGDASAMQAHLRGLDGTVERLGGLVGRTLVAGKSKEQTTGFFVGQADPRTAGLFRELGDDLDGQLERATDALAEECSDDEDWERALDAASGTVQTAYEAYTERLESMGVNPKPVC